MWPVILYYLELRLLHEVFDMAGLMTIFWIGLILGIVSLAVRSTSK